MIKDNIKLILKRQGRTQADLAAKMGVNKTLLQYYLKGNITIDKITKLANALNIEPFQLLRPIEQLQTELQNNTTQKNGQILCPYCGNPLTIKAEKII